MQEKLRRHIELLFQEAPRTRKTVELKEELFANSLDKFQDLIEAGYEEEEAYKNVVASIGDVSSLFDNLEEEEGPYESENSRKKRALIKAVAVGLYVFAGAIFIGIASLGNFLLKDFYWDRVGLVVALIICIIPTSMLVYVSSLKPAYARGNKSVVDDFKDWKSDQDNRKEIGKSIIPVIWTLTLVIYFTLSFLTGAWGVTWILFLVATCGTVVVNLIYNLKR